ncbi:Uncharacterised protein [Vibrio cholerae]|nr:Uncharacterised protein [Vibrio cholerae]
MGLFHQDGTKHQSVGACGQFHPLRGYDLRTLYLRRPVRHQNRYLESSPSRKPLLLAHHPKLQRAQNSSHHFPLSLRGRVWFPDRHAAVCLWLQAR